MHARNCTHSAQRVRNVNVAGWKKWLVYTRPVSITSTCYSIWWSDLPSASNCISNEFIISLALYYAKVQHILYNPNHKQLFSPEYSSDFAILVGFSRFFAIRITGDQIRHYSFQVLNAHWMVQKLRGRRCTDACGERGTRLAARMLKLNNDANQQFSNVKFRLENFTNVTLTTSTHVFSTCADNDAFGWLSSSLPIFLYDTLSLSLSSHSAAHLSRSHRRICNAKSFQSKCTQK